MMDTKISGSIRIRHPRHRDPHKHEEKERRNRRQKRSWFCGILRLQITAPTSVMEMNTQSKVREI